MEKDLISVVVPVYNVEDYLNRCVDSIVNQTYKNLEIILVDDGSTDSSGKICDDCAKDDERIKVIHKENGGLSDARNAGIDIASGKYITFVDSDDVISHDCVNFLYELLKNNNSSISVCDYQLFKDKIKVKKIKRKCVNYSRMEMLEYILYGGHNLISACGKLYDISLFNSVRYPKGCLYEDVYTTYLLYEKSENVVVSNEKKYFYFVRSNSITNKNFSKKNYEILNWIYYCKYISLYHIIK